VFSFRLARTVASLLAVCDRQVMQQGSPFGQKCCLSGLRITYLTRTGYACRLIDVDCATGSGIRSIAIAMPYLHEKWIC